MLIGAASAIVVGVVLVVRAIFSNPGQENPGPGSFSGIPVIYVALGAGLLAVLGGAVFVIRRTGGAPEEVGGRLPSAAEPGLRDEERADSDTLWPAADLGVAPAPSRSIRGIVVALLATLAVAIGLVAAVIMTGLATPADGASTPSSSPWTTWIVVAIVVAGVAALGLSIATSDKKGWRWIYDTRVLGLVMAFALISYGVTQLFPPGAEFDIRQLPGLAGNSLEGLTAQPESGYPRIKITKVGIDLLLVKGDGKTPPVKYEAFTYPNADHLLAGGGAGNSNSYVYAHARTGMFWNLHNLHIGDEIQVDYGGGKVYRYRVSEIHPRVSWKDFTWLQPTADDRLTLQTCNGWRDDDPRFIVVAHRITDTQLTNN